MEQFPDTYGLARDAQQLAASLVDTLPEFAHLADARLLVVESQRVPMLHGSPCQAFVAGIHIQGPLAQLCLWLLAGLAAPLLEWELPDFVVILDAALWPTLDVDRQERLLYHELSHIVARVDEETGLEKRSNEDQRILLKLVPHTYEFFDAEVRRYGPDVCDLVDAATAIADGHRHAQRRRLRVA